MQEQLQKDFSFNVEDFTVNQYVKLSTIDSESAMDELEKRKDAEIGKWWKCSFVDKLARGQFPSGEAFEAEVGRRLRSLAQRAMTFRTQQAIKSIEANAIDIGLPEARAIADNIQTKLCIVYNPDTAESGIPFPELNGERIVEKNVCVTSGRGIGSMTASYVMAEGQVFLIPFGSVECLYVPEDEMRIESADTDSDREFSIFHNFGMKIVTKPFRLKA